MCGCSGGKNININIKKIYTKTLLLYDFIFKVFPLVKEKLNYWKKYIAGAPDRELSAQGIMSIETKEFHAIGGSFFSLYNRDYIEVLTTIIVAYQTISDYLDNLCDRTGIYSELAFKKLHESMFDALSREAIYRDYYKHFPGDNDEGYLEELVITCNKNLEKLPAYEKVKEDIFHFTSLYRDLQVYKHDLEKGREKLINWFEVHRERSPDIRWWEFSCASGSTLLVFALLAFSTENDIDVLEKEKLIKAYFPWICGFHIMLDYFIDQSEDEKEGDMNLVSFYESEEKKESRLIYFCERSLEEANKLKNNEFHTTVVKGLMAMYLSDPKVREQRFQATAHKLLKKGGLEANLMFYICKILRARKTL